MALKEPDLNNPRCQPGVKQLVVIISSEGAEYFPNISTTILYF